MLICLMTMKDAVISQWPNIFSVICLNATKLSGSKKRSNNWKKKLSLLNMKDFNSEIMFYVTCLTFHLKTDFIWHSSFKFDDLHHGDTHSSNLLSHYLLSHHKNILCRLFYCEELSKIVCHFFVCIPVWKQGDTFTATKLEWIWTDTRQVLILCREILNKNLKRSSCYTNVCSLIR